MADEHEADGEGRERPHTAADRRNRRSASSSGGAASGGGASSSGGPTAVGEARPSRASLPSRIARYLREVIGELRKVIWPTRKQLINYTIVVLIFVAFMISLISLMDFVFGQGVLFLFGT